MNNRIKELRYVKASELVPDAPRIDGLVYDHGG